jgi:hypothetical protein
MNSILVAFVFLVTSQAFAQNLNAQRIWKISSKKRSIFLDKGVFHLDSMKGVNKLLNIRNSFFKSRGYERLVFDFEISNPPKMYGHISKNKKKIYIDFFNTTLNKEMSSISKIKYVKGVDFFTIDKKNLSVEVNLSDSVSYDIFYLSNPGRLVIDIQK